MAGSAIIIVLVGVYLWANKSPMEDFPYLVKDGQVYCADGSTRNDGTLVEKANATTFRRPTQQERDEALAKGPLFMIDAVDEYNSFYQCSWVNFSGTI